MNTEKHITSPLRIIVLILMLAVTFSTSASDGKSAVTIACQDPLLITAAPGQCDAVVILILPLIISPSPIVSLTNDFNGTSDASGVYPLGTTLVTWTAVNSVGEVGTCTTTVTVVADDNVAPVIQCTDMFVEVGSPVPAPLVTDQCEGFALRFDGVADHVAFDKDLGSVNGFTYEVYVKPVTTHEIDTEAKDNIYEGLSGQHFAIYPGFGEGAYGIGHSMLGISAGTNGVSVYEHSGGFLSAVLVYQGTISSTDFTHIAVTLQSDGVNATCVLYIDGVQVRSVAYPNNYAFIHPGLGYLPATTGGGIGGGGWGYFNGDIDEVAVWNHALTPSEVVTAYSELHEGTEPGIVAHFAFNEGSGTITHGAKGSGSFVGNPLWVQPGVSTWVVSNNITGNALLPIFNAPGVESVTWSSTDKNGNTSACVSNVTIVSSIDIVCASDIVVPAAPGTCSAQVTIPVPTVTGGVPSWVVYNTYTQTYDASATYPIGTTLVIWKVDKGGGVSSELCMVRVTVIDNQGPTIISCPSDIVQELSGCGFPVSVEAPVVEDNCSNGWALSFDGIDDEIHVDHDLNTIDKFTIEFYVTPTRDIDFTGYANQNYVIHPGNAAMVYGPGHVILGVSVGNNGLRVIRNNNDVLSDVLSYQIPIPTDKWTHVSLVFDRAGTVAPCKLYINGTYIHSDGWPTAETWHVSLGFNPAVTGGGIGGGKFGHFQGLMDEVRVWDYERTIQDMSSDRRRELTGIEPHLTAYYNFNGGPSDNRIRGSAGSYDLLNMNSATAWIQPDAIEDITIINSFNNSTSATDIYPVGFTTVNWTFMDKFGNISTCSNTVQVNALATVELVCLPDVTINNEPDKCGAPFSIDPPLSGSISCEGYALQFDGEDDYVTMDRDLGVTDNFTIEMWVKPTGTFNFFPWGITSVSYAIYPGLPELYETPSVVFGLTSHSTVGIAVGVNGIGVYEHSYEYLPMQCSWQSQLPMTEWTHVAVTYNNNMITIFVNGEEKITAQRQIDGRTVHATLGIPGGGGGIGGGIYGKYQGAMDEVRIWDFAKTAQQVIHDKDVELKGTEAGLKAYYNFNEGTGKTSATSRFGAAELINMDAMTAWIQPDPIKDYTLVNNISGSGVIAQEFPVGQTTVTWTLTDKFGAVTTCSSVVTVIDVQAPVVQCPESHTVFVPDGSFNKDIVFEDIIASDNCGIKSIVNTYSSSENPSGLFPVGTTEIIFTVTDVNGNETPCAAIKVVVQPTTLTIPTGISPNGDGLNDAWVLHGLEYFDHADVKIYNRNGDLVYEGNGYDNTNTVFNGAGNRGVYAGSQILPNGTYFYHLKTTPDNELKDFTGFIEISK